MVFCKKCGTEIGNGVKYCPKCGTMASADSVVDMSSSVSETKIDAQVLPPEPVVTTIASISTSNKKTNRRTILVVISVVAVIAIVAVLFLMPTKYEIDLSTNGSGMVYGSGSYESGDMITIRAAGTNGMEFYKWSDGNTSASRTISVDGDKSLVAYFAYFYDISVKSNYSDGGSISGGGHIKQGDSVTIRAEPSYGYYFSHWMKDGSRVSSNPSYTFTANSDATYVAVFELRSFTIQAYSSNSGWGECSGGGTYLYKSSVTLYANSYSGYEFLGWYDGSSYLGNLRTYTFNVESDVTFTAKFGIIHDASFSFEASASLAPVTLSINSKYTVEYSNRYVTFMDAMTGSTLLTYNGSSNSSLSTSISSGTAVKVVQKITYTDGYTASYTDTYVVNENVTHKYSWKYNVDKWYSFFTDFFSLNNSSDSFTWDLSFKWYYKYYSDPIPRNINGAADRIDDFVTSDDSWIKSLAKYLNNQSSSMSDIERVNYVLKFVQSFEYQYDKDGKNVQDYWKYPAEILWEQKGDCEDHAILFATLMEAMGYDAVLYYVYCYDSSGNFTAAHLATGVAVSGASGTSTTFQGKTYYYCEATSDAGSRIHNWANVGYIPTGYVIQRTYQVS
ncbi:MAG: zinc-ribbon domain-containing protein [Thermoplasmata archaeon]|nr:zinc-ribbon domain-containing protein [Thermoplasmata archaeon]MBE6523896.1 zinc-ribbon domain-containing protein [Thermoplasmata archaeon]